MELAVYRRASAFLVSAMLVAMGSAASFSSGQNARPPSFMSGNDMIFDVRNGDQQGKLILSDTELAFESLTDATHSRRWKYADIRELSRKKKDLRVRPFRGATYDFQFKKKQDRDKIYDLIAARIVAYRQGSK